jgi:trypsin
VNLPSPNFQVTPGNQAVVSGWGDLEFGSRQYPDILQHVFVPVLSNAQCQTIYDEEEILYQHICAGETGRDACQGDSGGPLAYNNIQVGVVSWGYGCAMDWPTVYARVSEFLGYITQQMSRP